MGAAPSLIVGSDEYEGKGYLFQGGEDILDDPAFFNRHNISHVVGICHRSVGTHVFDETKLTPDTVIHINELDSTTTNLYPYLERTTRFIHSARMGGGNVYVHCSAGISRSSTVTLSYMMTVYDLPFLELLGHLRRMRSCVHPNTSFQEQLRQWQTDPKRLTLREEILKQNEQEWERIYRLDKETFLSGKSQPVEEEETEEWD
uniref:Protein-tyrosine-phosphatase n=1 Tax=Paramoeba aestuarina TaxID=180227 RepID=A0A7S4PBD8_9EUKA|mmetsp:Transcript_39713/g.62791  ORF Transcript_39713/g.62791 Transcript_39713/m.62791 type:complete len:203 (+) Transcript_39713:68-676(+)